MEFNVQHAKEFVNARIQSNLKKCDNKIHMLLHLIPLSEVKKTASDLKNFKNKDYSSDAFNLEGYKHFDNNYDNHIQLYRDGKIELLKTWGEEKIIPSLSYEETIINQTKRFFEFYIEQKIVPPIFLNLAFINVDGTILGIDEFKQNFETSKVNQETIISLPELIIRTFEEDADVLLKEVFDCLWNVFDFESSYNYDDTGKFKNKKIKNLYT
jgi:hypothetical protein